MNLNKGGHNMTCSSFCRAIKARLCCEDDAPPEQIINSVPSSVSNVDHHVNDRAVQAVVQSNGPLGIIMRDNSTDLVLQEQSRSPSFCQQRRVSKLGVNCNEDGDAVSISNADVHVNDRTGRGVVQCSGSSGIIMEDGSDVLGVVEQSRSPSFWQSGGVGRLSLGSLAARSFDAAKPSPHLVIAEDCLFNVRLLLFQLFKVINLINTTVVLSGEEADKCLVLNEAFKAIPFRHIDGLVKKQMLIDSVTTEERPPLDLTKLNIVVLEPV